MFCNVVLYKKSGVKVYNKFIFLPEKFHLFFLIMSTKPLKDKGPKPVLPEPLSPYVTYQDFFDLLEVTKGLVERINYLEETLLDNFPQLENRLGESIFSQETLSESGEEPVDLTDEPNYEFQDYDPATYFV